MDLKEDFKRIQGAGLSGLCFAFVVAATPLLSGCSPELVRGVVRQSVGAGTVDIRNEIRRGLRHDLRLRVTACPGGGSEVPGEGPVLDLWNRLFSSSYIPQLGDGTCRGVDPSPYREGSPQGTPLDSYPTHNPLWRRREY